MFFDSLGIRWQYEPEAFALPSGNYLPDFHLMLDGATRGVWFEVKHENFAEDDPRWDDLARESTVFVAFGIPRGVSEEDVLDSPRGNGRIELRDHGTWDNFYAFCICPKCSKVGIEFEGRGARVCSNCLPDGDREHTYMHSAILQAYAEASSARFEHWRVGRP